MVKKTPPPRKNTSKDIVPVVTGEEVELVREAPEARMMDVKDVLHPLMEQAALRMLVNRTPSWAIKVRQGRGGRSYKYVPHGYVTDQLNKVSGFDWDLVIEQISDGKMYALELEPVFDKNGKQVDTIRHIAVAGYIVVRFHDKNGKLLGEVKKSGFGSQTWLPTMEFGDALKAARSDLVKTCAYQLGIALDLYYNERAEVEEFIVKVRKQTESERVAEKLNTGIPDTPILFLSRCMADYKLDGDSVADILGLASFDLIMTFNPGQIKEAWAKVKSTVEK